MAFFNSAVGVLQDRQSVKVPIRGPLRRYPDTQNNHQIPLGLLNFLDKFL